MYTTPSLDLIEYVEQNILPRYTAFDKAHGLAHVSNVIRQSIELANLSGADINMCYVVAAYHDLGLSGPRAIHHVTSGKILFKDNQLKRWFSPQQIIIMKEAVEDHRASASRAPRSLYGRIVAEADRDLAPDSVIRRTIQFGLSKSPDINKEKLWDRVRKHLDEKYSTHGYIHLWMQGSPNEEKLKELRLIISDETKLRNIFDSIYSEETL